MWFSFSRKDCCEQNLTEWNFASYYWHDTLAGDHDIGLKASQPVGRTKT